MIIYSLEKFAEVRRPADRALAQYWKDDGFSGALVVQNLPASPGATGDVGSIPGLGRTSGEGHGNPLQYSCLENPMDRGAWQATAQRVAKSGTGLKRLSMQARTEG